MNLNSLILIYSLISFVQYHTVNSDCSYKVSGHSIDLSSLKGETLSITDGQWTYNYSPCENGLTCTDKDSVTQSAMADQFKEGNDYCTAYLALWVEVEPTYSDSTFTFTWSNGKSSNTCDDGRSFIAVFSCGTSDYDVTGISQSSDGCDYTMTIESKYACDSGGGGGGGSGGSGGGGSTDSDLSVGSILLIIVVGIIILYCIIGYVICAKKNPDNGWGNVKANTPHLNFWCLIPKLAWAGCCVTKEFTVNKVNQIRGKTDDSAYDSVDEGM